MQDFLLTVSDLYFCYEGAKAARRALTTLATKNIHVVGRFNSPPPSSDSLPLDLKATRKCSYGSMARSCEGCKFSGANEDRNILFPPSADHEQDWQPYPVDPYSAESAEHTFIYTCSVYIAWNVMAAI